MGVWGCLWSYRVPTSDPAYPRVALGSWGWDSWDLLSTQEALGINQMCVSWQQASHTWGPYPSLPGQGMGERRFGATSILTGVTVSQAGDRGGQLFQGKTGALRPNHLPCLQKKSSQQTDKECMCASLLVPTNLGG